MPTSLRRIVVPSDRSAASTDAARHALRLALSTGAVLEIPHARARDHHEPSWSVPHFAQLAALRDHLVRWGVIAPGTPTDALGVDVRLTTVQGADPVGTLQAHLEADPPDLMVVSTEARSGVQRLLHASVAERLARATPGPTLFLPAGTRALLPEDGAPGALRVLLPCGSAVEGELAAFDAVDLLDALGVPRATFTLLHVGWDGAALALPTDARWTWVSARTDGAVVEQVLEAARATDTDLIAMATHGHDSVLDAALGSRAERVVRAAPCPVLVVPIRQAP